ncbi:hypothetical protein Hanom_Chr03g00219471 [Helianthus anomalus]
MGPIDVEKKKASKRKDVVVQVFRNQFKHMYITRLSPVQMMNYILDWQADDGRLFVRNFLILYFSLLGETTTNNSVNVRFISNIQPDVDIKSFNWCAYMVTCLKRTKTTWHGGDDAFRGPMLLLAVNKKPKRAEGDESGGKQIKKQKQRLEKGMEKENPIDEGNEEIEIEDDDAHLGIYRHCADYLLSQTDTQTCVLFVGPDGEVRIPMVSQYRDTPSAS